MAIFRDQPDPSNDASMHAARVMAALQREYDGDPMVPRFVVVVEVPPGDVGIASTGDDPPDTARMLWNALQMVRAAIAEAARDN